MNKVCHENIIINDRRNIGRVDIDSGIERAERTAWSDSIHWCKRCSLNQPHDYWWCGFVFRFPCLAGAYPALISIDYKHVRKYENQVTWTWLYPSYLIVSVSRICLLPFSLHRCLAIAFYILIAYSQSGREL